MNAIERSGGKADAEADTMSESRHESRQSGTIDEVTLASCRYRAMDIVWGPEGDKLTVGEVRARLEYEYGVDVCRAALAPESE